MKHAIEAVTGSSVVEDTYRYVFSSSYNIGGWSIEGAQRKSHNDSNRRTKNLKQLNGGDKNQAQADASTYP